MFSVNCVVNNCALPRLWVVSARMCVQWPESISPWRTSIIQPYYPQAISASEENLRTSQTGKGTLSRRTESRLDYSYIPRVKINPTWNRAWDMFRVVHSFSFRCENKLTVDKKIMERFGTIHLHFEYNDIFSLCFDKGMNLWPWTKTTAWINFPVECINKELLRHFAVCLLCLKQQVRLRRYCGVSWKRKVSQFLET